MISTKKILTVYMNLGSFLFDIFSIMPFSMNNLKPYPHESKIDRSHCQI